jgi:hypothetical protein
MIKKMVGNILTDIPVQYESIVEEMGGFGNNKNELINRNNNSCEELKSSP